MSNLKIARSEFLLSAHLIIENASSDTVIKNALAGFGFSGEKFMSGKRLYTEASELDSIQKRKYGEQMEATAELNRIWASSKQHYIKTLKIARLAFKEYAKADKMVFLHGPRKKSLSGWLIQAQVFYANILRDNELMDALLEYGYTPEKLRQESALIDAVGEKHLEQKRKIGDAQEATAARDKKIAELAKWISDFKVVARVALTDDLQQLEKLGIVVKGKG